MEGGAAFALPTWAELAQLAPVTGIVLVIQAVTVLTVLRVIKFTIRELGRETQ